LRSAMAPIGLSGGAVVRPPRRIQRTAPAVTCNVNSRSRWRCCGARAPIGPEAAVSPPPAPMLSQAPSAFLVRLRLGFFFRNAGGSIAAGPAPFSNLTVEPHPRASARRLYSSAFFMCSAALRRYCSCSSRRAAAFTVASLGSADSCARAASITASGG